MVLQNFSHCFVCVSPATPDSHRAPLPLPRAARNPVLLLLLFPPEDAAGNASTSEAALVCFERSAAPLMDAAPASQKLQALHLPARIVVSQRQASGAVLSGGGGVQEVLCNKQDAGRGQGDGFGSGLPRTALAVSIFECDRTKRLTLRARG